MDLAQDIVLAERLLAARDGGAQIAPLTSEHPGFDMAAAQRVAAAVRQIRQARGERVVGRKIGFTNRTLWPLYNVGGPIWGDVFDTTLRDLQGAVAEVPLPQVPEPRIEPEIVFGLGAAPEAGMDLAALTACIDWAAHGFEVVSSVFPGWTFAAPDTQAAFGLHGALFVGPRQGLARLGADPAAALSALRLRLTDGIVTAEGRGADVLDGPVQALGFLVEGLAAAGAPALGAGDVVTTGTLTDAMPLRRGARWRTQLSPAVLPGLDVTFV